MEKPARYLMLLALLAAFPACRESVPLMNLYGFTALRPPCNLYQAGAIVSIEYEDRAGQPTVAGLKVVCGPRASLGANWMPLESSTVASSSRQEFKQSWSVEAEVLDKIKSKTSLKDVASIQVTLEHARILEVQDVDVWENIANRSEACVRAIEARLAGGFTVTMVTSNIVADITYNVSFSREASLDKKVQMERMQDMAVALGGGHTYIDEHQIQANNLAVGIKTDQFLLAMSLPEGAMKMEHRGLEVDAADADACPDAPVVHAPGGQVQRTRGRAR